MYHAAILITQSDQKNYNTLDTPGRDLSSQIRAAQWETIVYSVLSQSHA